MWDSNPRAIIYACPGTLNIIYRDEPSTLTKSRYYWYRYFKSRYQIPYRAESARIGKCRSNKIPVPIIPGFRHSVDGRVRNFLRAELRRRIFVTLYFVEIQT